MIGPGGAGRRAGAYDGAMRWIAWCVWGGLCLIGMAACGGCEDGPAAARGGVADLADPGGTAAPAASPRPSDDDSSIRLAGGPYPGPGVAELRREPAVRVRLHAQMSSVTLTAESRLRVAGPRGGAVASKVYPFSTPLEVRRVLAGNLWVWELHEAGGRVVRWQLPELLVECDVGGAIGLGELTYPRRLVLVPRTDAAGAETGRFDVVNHVPMETYLAGVIERELYGGWPLETFKAQAVAARSYAVWEQTIARGRSFDLESTTASQAYVGRASNPRAVQAVAETRGEFLVYAGRVVPAFYSSSTGGTGQDAVVAFPNRVENIPPLRAREHGAWDKDSPQWRWGPVQRPTATLARRLAAWGRDRPGGPHPIAELSQLRRIEVAGRNAIGRPAAYHIIGIDRRGRAAEYLLDAESFRVAGNDTDDDRLPLDKGQRFLSSHLEVSVGPSVTTVRGRGYGHGVGMSQWGARTMAQAGHGYRAILDFYYPGAEVKKLY